MPATKPTLTELRLGTRRSPLAMVQAHETRDRLCAAHGWAPEAVEIVPVLSSGDRIRDRPLAEIGGKALWTRELDQWLIEGRIDIAVHSMKDVETIRPSELIIGAILPREDRRDVLLGAQSIAALPRDAIVGTSAPRRAAQLLNRRPDCKVVTFRGNVATRMAKLAAGEVQATFLAAAGLNRLGEGGAGTPLDQDDWLPAPAQAAIGIECRTNDSATREKIGAINDLRSEREILSERAVLAGLGGSCHSPVAMLSRWDEEKLFVRARIYSPQGEEQVEREAQIACEDDAAGLARELINEASPLVRAVFAGT